MPFPFVKNINRLKTNKLKILGYGLQLIARVFRFACNQKLELSKQSKVRNYVPLPFTAWGFRSCNGERFRV